MKKEYFEVNIDVEKTKMNFKNYVLIIEFISKKFIFLVIVVLANINGIFFYIVIF